MHSLGSMQTSARTLYDKSFEDHIVSRHADGTYSLYIDRHLIEDHASPQAFDGLRHRGLRLHAPHKTLAVVDHDIPTTDRTNGILDPQSRAQVEALARNVEDFGIEYFDEHDVRQGIVHVTGPEQASPCREQRSCAVIAIRRRTAPLALWRSASELRRSNTF